MALSDTLATADTRNYVFLHPKTGGVESRRVVIIIIVIGSGGSIRTDTWDGTSWVPEGVTEAYATDQALDQAIGIKRAAADAANAAEEAAQLLTDSATVVNARLATAGAPTPTVAELRAAMDPGSGGQTVFDLTRK